MSQRTEEGAWAVAPFVRQCLAVGSTDVDAVIAAGDGIEAGGVDDHVELMVVCCGLNAGLGDAFDGSVGQ